MVSRAFHPGKPLTRLVRVGCMDDERGGRVFDPPEGVEAPRRAAFAAVSFAIVFLTLFAVMLAWWFHDPGGVPTAPFTI